MKFKILSGFLGVLVSGLAPLAAMAAPKERPNVVFILVDDLRWDGLSCMGHPYAKTPNIDRIAKEGVLFKNFFVSIPLCAPSRASFLTGEYPHKHGVTNNADHAALSHRLVTFPRLLHDQAGYTTAFIGKWHMGTDDSPRPGFDRWVSFKGQGVYQDPVLNIDGKAAKANGYITDLLNEQALNFIKQQSGSPKPFLLYLSHKAVHGPFTPADRHKDLYDEAALRPVPSFNDSLEGKPVLTRKIEEAAGAPKGKKKGKGKKAARPGGGAANVARNQLRALAAIDEGVGQLFQALQDAKQLDRTVFIFTSDNGYFWGEHGLGDKRWAYEESIRDPLLIRYPSLIKPGTTLDQMVLNIDIAPTLLELGGVAIPASVQGRSLIPILKDHQAPWRHAFLTEYFQEKQFPRTPTWQAVRTDRWKYIQYLGSPEFDELYDLKADPYEMKNLVKDPSSSATLKELKSELNKLRGE